MANQLDTPSRLLLVEDDLELQELLSSLLLDEGYLVTSASSVARARSLLDEQVFGLILTDLFTATPNEALSSVEPLRASAHPTPVGIMTGWPLPPEMVLQRGFAFLLKKPFDLDDLLITLAGSFQVSLTPEQTRFSQQVQQFLAALNARDWQKLYSLCTDDFVYYPPLPSVITQERRLRGVAAYQSYLETVFAQLPNAQCEQIQVYGRPKGLIARFLFCWQAPSESRNQVAVTMPFHFAGDRVRQVGIWRNATRMRTLMDKGLLISG